ncbi:protein ATAF2-like [Ziziphus jujuba]|uniref:Protein ATAF2-like n=1 Tax=Ziziphus jujuba TaxID=326968 RepID=A0A6P3ZQ53_ZIZJJ|nr:protein ATAF2-like [Ziziphus jujuba]
METDKDSSSPSVEAQDFPQEPKFQSVGGQEIKFQVGYRFCPYDHELLNDYLKKKLANECLPANRIFEVNLYKFNPEDLSERYKLPGEKECYFFTPRDRKYKNGSRPNRAAGDGYWKATGADKRVKDNNNIHVGYKKSLVFYRGKPTKGTKTNWIMHEFRLNEPPPCTRRGADDMRLDDWVICRIYEKAVKGNYKSKTTRIDDEDQEEPEDEDEVEEHQDNQEETKHDNSGPGEYTEFEKIVAQPIDNYYNHNFVHRDFYANNVIYETYLGNQLDIENQFPYENQLLPAMDNQHQIMDYGNQKVHHHLPALMNDNDFGMLGSLYTANMVDQPSFKVPPSSIFRTKYLSNLKSLPEDQ